MWYRQAVVNVNPSGQIGMDFPGIKPKKFDIENDVDIKIKKEGFYYTIYALTKDGRELGHISFNAGDHASTAVIDFSTLVDYPSYIGKEDWQKPKNPEDKLKGDLVADLKRAGYDADESSVTRLKWGIGNKLYRELKKFLQQHKPNIDFVEGTVHSRDAYDSRNAIFGLPHKAYDPDQSCSYKISENDNVATREEMAKKIGYELDPARFNVYGESEVPTSMFRVRHKLDKLPYEETESYKQSKGKIPKIDSSPNLFSTASKRTAAEKHPWLSYPLSKEIPEGSRRRLHYTRGDDVLQRDLPLLDQIKQRDDILLDQIKQQGLLVDKSRGHIHGDPKAIFSNPASPEMLKDLQQRGSSFVEFHAPEESIIGNQYSYADVTPEQILGVYPSWYSKLTYLVENRGVEDSIKFLNENDVLRDGMYSQVYKYLLKMEWLQRHNIQVENGKFVFYHGTRADLPENILRAKSLLETSPEEARKWGNENTRNDRRKKLNVYKVLVDLFDFETGFWATTNKDLRVTKVG
jgi:hypothetical protein